MITEELIDKVAHLPTTPGVYLWYDAYKRIIYVGKAINLRNRVRSYVRQDAKRSVKVQAMIDHAADVEVIQTKTEMEALILENNLIKEHHPKYNIMLRDDKTYPYIKVTVKEEFPRLLLARRISKDGARYFGPFTDVGAVHRSIAVLHQIYPLRTCRSMATDRPCLQYHIHRCEAPCQQKVSAEEYRHYIDDILLLFEGKPSPVFEKLKKRMEEASENLAFEEAALYRDQLKALEKMQEKQKIVTEKGDLDVVGIATAYGITCVQIFFIRGGRMLGRENFFTESKEDSEESIMTQFLKQYYSGNPVLPKDIILPIESTEEELLSEWLSERKGARITMKVPQRGYKMDLLKMASENARTFLEERHRQWQHTVDKSEGALLALQNILQLPRLPYRMECFDISHTQGTETVASMVVFEGGKPAKKEYRRFKLQTTEGKPDDFKSMAEIMTRRYGKEKDWPNPDLIIIDGGKGQLHATIPMIRQAGFHDVPIISLAKRIEEVFVEGQKESIILSHHTPELQLLQHIRDEAHRFAITYHRKLRGKRNVRSILDHIDGVGPKRRQALWKAFGSLDAMKKASVEELADVEGMNYKVAQQIYDFFRMSKADKQKILDPHMTRGQ